MAALHDETVRLAHGGGGSLTSRLLAELIWPVLAVAERGEDAALADGVLVSTDSYVVRPMFFPGGDVGKLAVYGTVNDLAMRGGRPVAITVALIIEEGVATELLARVVRSIADAAARCGVAVVGGDTKVVEAGRGDGIFVNTTGVARPLAPAQQLPSIAQAAAGDAVLINGSIGEHGIAVLAAREELDFAAEIESDCAPLHEMVAALIAELGPKVHCLHDPTRGGLAAALNEIALASAKTITVEESDIPVTPAVVGACELLGLDPLEVANEGKLVAVVDASAADAALAIMKNFEVGRGAAVIGEVSDAQPVRVNLRTQIGTVRMVSMPSGELLPRIC
ncbi:MAG: hydrogenase expression/formation protein HypE [Armatimonadetes bacterium]|nr:hydrogenase expression/formation protein HypE [Armatimonadota bacterium]